MLTFLPVEQLEAILSSYKLPFLLCLLGLVLLVGGLFSSGLVSNFVSKPKVNIPKESLVAKDELTQIKVDIAGAVNNPGVYSLTKDSRVEDVIKAAQGFKESVNKEFVSKSLNLSQKISDGQKIYIPFSGEQGKVLAASTTTSSQTNVDGKVGINSGSSEQLDSLPGIGPVTSAKVIAGRPYNSVEELLSKKVVSKSVYDKVKDLVDLN